MSKLYQIFCRMLPEAMAQFSSGDVVICYVLPV